MQDWAVEPNVAEEPAGAFSPDHSDLPVLKEDVVGKAVLDRRRGRAAVTRRGLS
jgi:hypothetical protein